jgi:hypothetical protein
MQTNVGKGVPTGGLNAVIFICTLGRVDVNITEYSTKYSAADLCFL